MGRASGRSSFGLSRELAFTIRQAARTEGGRVPLSAHYDAALSRQSSATVAGPKLSAGRTAGHDQTRWRHAEERNRIGRSRLPDLMKAPTAGAPRRWHA